MNANELLKLLKKNDCYLNHHGKKHDIWHSNITGKNIPIPRHKAEIAEGILKSILKDAGLK